MINVETACRGKRKFKSKPKTMAAIIALAKSGSKNGWVVPYKCPFCKHWHFGHQPRRLKEGAK